MIVHSVTIVLLLSNFLCNSNSFLADQRLRHFKGIQHNRISSFILIPDATLHHQRFVKYAHLSSKKETLSRDRNTGSKAAFALAALVVQNSALALLMRLSRVATKAHSNMYIVSTAVVVSEFVKVIVSLMGCFNEDAKKDLKVMCEKIKKSSKLSDLLMISVPAALYVLQNNLQYVAMSNLPAEVYQVLIQGKIITAAVFSVLILNKRYSAMQWSSVFTLSLGVALVQSSLHTSAVTTSYVNFAIGITSVLISTLTSGFASIFLEKMLKTEGGFWVKNIQLSFMSFLIASIGCFLKDSGSIYKRGFFVGYDPLVLSVILTQALGGMLVAFVVRYTNSIVKGFAASGSIVLSCLISALFLNDYKLSKMFTVGTGLVCASAVAWAISPSPISKLINLTIEEAEKISDNTVNPVRELEKEMIESSPEAELISLGDFVSAFDATTSIENMAPIEKNSNSI